MDEFGDIHYLGVACEALLEPILHGLDVMIGARLDGLDGGGVVFVEACVGAIKRRDGRAGEWRTFFDCRVAGQIFQPFEFDANTIADQAEFGKVGTKAVQFVGITLIQCGDLWWFRSARYCF